MSYEYLMEILYYYHFQSQRIKNNEITMKYIILMNGLLILHNRYVEKKYAHDTMTLD